jgi:hypothetical protein
MDYPVPNFGARDREVNSVWSSINAAEEIRRHRWVVEEDDLKKTEEKHTDYDFKPELDNDIINTNEHIEAAEKSIAES